MANPISYLKISKADGFYSIPIYPIYDFPDSPLRIMTNNGIGCLNLVDSSFSTPLRIMTRDGVKGVSTEVEVLQTIVKENLLCYYNVKYGFSSSSWQNIAPNRNQSAFPKRMTMREEGIVNDVTYGSYIEVTLPSEMNITTAFTLETRFSATAFSAGWFSGYASNATEIYAYGSVSTSTVTANLPHEDLTTLLNHSFSTPTAANTFYTFSLVYDGEYSLSLYVNGQFIRTRTTTAKLRINTINKLTFGESTRSTNTYKFIRIYNKALTQEEIINNFNVGDEIGL